MSADLAEKADSACKNKKARARVMVVAELWQELIATDAPWSVAIAWSFNKCLELLSLYACICSHEKDFESETRVQCHGAPSMPCTRGCIIFHNSHLHGIHQKNPPHWFTLIQPISIMLTSAKCYPKVLTQILEHCHTGLAAHREPDSCMFGFRKCYRCVEILQCFELPSKYARSCCYHCACANETSCAHTIP